MNKNCDNDEWMNECMIACMHTYIYKKEKVIIGKVNKTNPVDVVVVDSMYLLIEMKKMTKALRNKGRNIR